MRPTANSDESVTAHRSAHVGRYADHLSRRPKEQISGSKNAQTEYETHLSHNIAHSSIYGPGTTSSNAERHVNGTPTDRQNVTGVSENPERKDQGIDTRDDLSPQRYWSCCAVPRLWCVKLCARKKEYADHVLSEPTKRLFKRIKRSKKCGKPDETTTMAVDDNGVSIAPHQESMSLRSAREKSMRSRKRDEEAEAFDKDVPEDERKKRKERRKREKKEKERKEREREEQRARREEQMLQPVDVRLMTRDEDLGRQQHPPVTDFTKSCCYLCAQNTLAIAAAATKPEQSDKCVQVSAHKLRAEIPLTLDRSCSPTLLLMRAVQSSVKVRTRETSTLCPDVGNKVTERSGTRKRKKFSLLPRLTRTKCPAGRHAVCETDKTTLAERDDNVEKLEPRSKRCCREKTV